MSTPLEKLDAELLTTGLDTDKDLDQVPLKFKDLLALVNNVDSEKLLKDLTPAVMIMKKDLSPALGGTDPFSLFTPFDVGKPKYDDDELADKSDIVVPKNEKKDRPAKTVGDLIDESQETYIALAKLLDLYIRLVIREMVVEESLIE